MGSGGVLRDDDGGRRRSLARDADDEKAATLLRKATQRGRAAADVRAVRPGECQVVVCVHRVRHLSASDPLLPGSRASLPVIQQSRPFP